MPKIILQSALLNLLKGTLMVEFQVGQHLEGEDIWSRKELAQCKLSPPTLVIILISGISAGSARACSSQ